MEIDAEVYMDPQARITETLRVFGDSEARAAELLCDRHPADRTAITLVGTDMTATEATFGELRERSQRVAAVLDGLGVGPGDRVATLMGKSLDLVAVMLGTWRLGAVYVPLFTAFAPQAIGMRLADSRTRVVVVDAAQRPKLDPSGDMPAGDWSILESRDAPPDRDARHLQTLMAHADWDPDASPAVTGGNGALVHTFTSGTTGKPKGVVHPLRYVAGWQIYLEYALGVTGEDVFWCGADPGWAYGLYAAIAGPMATATRSILYAGSFDVAATWRVLSDYEVTNFAAAPTVYRALRATPAPPPNLSLRRASSAGEPLTPEVNEWALPTLGLEVHDHFGQTEVGMVLANHHHPQLARPLKEGSMGRPLPGWDLTILESEADRPAPVNTLGRLAVDVESSRLMTFKGYDGADSASKFAGDGRWFLLGDAARVDEDGDFFFQSRDDDVIIMAGYRIGPFEIESVIAQHPAVAECAVIGAPDAARGEVLEAYVVLRPEHSESKELATEIQTLVKQRYAAHAYPRAVHFASALPKTPSGKIQRFLLRRQRTAQLGEATLA